MTRTLQDLDSHRAPMTVSAALEELMVTDAGKVEVEVVAGMFIGVPIKHAKALETLSLALEKEDFDLKAIGKKVWEHVAKILAAIIAAIKGFIKWMMTGGKNRGLTEEVAREFDLAIKAITSWKATSYEDKIESVIKADKLAEKYEERFRKNFEMAVASTTNAYNDVVSQISWQLCASSLQNALKERASYLHDKVLKNSSSRLPSEQQAPGELPQVTKLMETIEKARAERQSVEHDLKDFKIGTSVKDSAFNASVIGHHFNLSRVAKMESDYATIMGDVVQQLERATGFVTQASQRAQGEEASEVARVALADLQAFFKLMKDIMLAVKIVTDLTSAANQAVWALCQFRTESLKATIATYPHDSTLVGALESEIKHVSELEHSYLNTMGFF